MFFPLQVLLESMCYSCIIKYTFLFFCKDLKDKECNYILISSSFIGSGHWTPNAVHFHGHWEAEFKRTSPQLRAPICTRSTDVRSVHIRCMDQSSGGGTVCSRLTIRRHYCCHVACSWSRWFVYKVIFICLSYSIYICSLWVVKVWKCKRKKNLGLKYACKGHSFKIQRDTL